MSNLKDLLISKIGPYTPQVVTAPDGSVYSKLGIGSLDYVWIFSAILIIVGFIGFILIVKSVLTSLVR